MILVYFAAMVACFWGLARVCDDIFVPSLESIAARFKMNDEVAGATLMAIGSSAPELFTAILALSKISQGDVSIGSGTIVGSAIFNVLVIVGATSLFLSATYKLFWQPVIRDMGFYLLSVLLILFFFWDEKMTLMEASILGGIYIVYIICVAKWSSWLGYTIPPLEQDEDECESKLTTWSRKHMNWGFVAGVGIIGLLSHIMVESAVHFAHGIGVSATIIGLTVLAAGTSVPDLLSSIIVAKKGRGGMAVSNAIGSNIFDIFVGIGLVYAMFLFFTPHESIPIDRDNLISSVLLLFATVISLTGMLLFRKWRLGKMAGVMLLVLYVAYVVFIVYNVTT